jgi:sulfite exporter TauE/SafE
MKRTVLWILSALGFSVVLWLLLNAPTTGFTGAKCHSVLGTGTSPAYGANGVARGAIDSCTTRQTVRLGWALLVALPTVVLASAALHGRNPRR